MSCFCIYNEEGVKIGGYTYDAWGNFKVSYTAGISYTESEVVSNNPFRYRGYYYDTYTGWYYLQTRYYDPSIGRFINADGYVSTGQGLLSYNMFAYCNNNPVNYVDSTGQSWSSFVEAFVEGIKSMSPAYAACGGAAVADGLLPVGDLIALAGALLLTAGAVGYGLYQASQAPAISIPQVEEKEEVEVIPKPPKKDGKTYYHVTTYENAMLIMGSGIMTGSSWEGGYVYAWRFKPSYYAIKNSGAHFGAIISFKTDASFTNDMGIDDPNVIKYFPVVSTNPGPIMVWDVKIVG